MLGSWQWGFAAAAAAAAVQLLKCLYVLHVHAQVQHVVKDNKLLLLAACCVMQLPLLALLGLPGLRSLCTFFSLSL